MKYRIVMTLLFLAALALAAFLSGNRSSSDPMPGASPTPNATSSPDSGIKLN